MRGWVRTFLLLPALALAGSASAEEPITVDSTGFYVELGGTGAGTLDKKDVGGGFRFQTGYRIHSFVGVEAELEFIDDLVGGPDDDKIDVWSVGGNAKLFAPPWENGQLYALVGAGLVSSVIEDSSDDESEFAPRFGGGLEVLVWRNLLATVEVVYVMPTSGDLEDLDYVAAAVGLQYRF